MRNDRIMASVTEWFKVPDLRFSGIKPWWGNPREFEPRRWHFFCIFYLFLTVEAEATYYFGSYLLFNQ